MAKRVTRTAPASAEQTLTAYAETLGTAMGTLRNHVDTWKGQRKHLVEQLSNMVSEAQSLLTDLGHSAGGQLARMRGGRKGKKYLAPAANPAGALKPSSKKGKRRLSPAGRAAISAAQKARWAAYKSKRPQK